MEIHTENILKPYWKHHEHILKTYSGYAQTCLECVLNLCFISNAYILVANPGRKDTERTKTQNMLKTYAQHNQLIFLRTWSIVRLCFDYVLSMRFHVGKFGIRVYF